jgi:LysM repeat protein
MVTPTSTPRPTATPRVATPIATATPTITPTPIIYTVQPGDTLLKIALQFDRSGEAIQETNGIVDPRFLQIGQTLIIPPAKEGPDNPPTPTATPLPLDITAINFQKTSQDTLWCLGVVTNPGPLPLTQVVIEASLLDSGGALLAREAAFTQLDVLQPGRSSPFAILFDSPPSSFAQYQIGAVSALPWSEQTRYYFDLEVFDLQGSPEGIATYRVTGQLRNRGLIDAEAIRLVIVAYDQDERLLAQRQAELAVNILKAGATTPFEIDLIIRQGVVGHVEVLAEALQAQ